MREYLEKANRLNTACLGISAAILLPSLAVWGISLFRVRKQGDPVRSGTRWIKAVWSIWLIALILDVSTRAITTYLSYGSGLGSVLFDSQDSSAENIAALAEMRRVMDLTKAGNHLGNVSTLFGYFADVALFGTFLALAWGLLTAVDGFTRPGSRYTSKTWLVWVPFAASALVLLGVSLAHFGLYTDYVGKYLEQRDLVLVVDDGSDDSERDFRIFELGTEMRDLSKAMNKVSGAAACVYFAFFTGMVGYVFYYPAEPAVPWLGLVAFRGCVYAVCEEAVLGGLRGHACAPSAAGEYGSQAGGVDGRFACF